jgi:3-oxoadipate enol-lactonase
MVMTRTGLVTAFLIVLGAAAGLCQAQETIEAARAGDLAIVQALMAKSPETASAMGPTDEWGRTPDRSVKVEKSYADINGGKIYYEIAGEGKPVILVHGPCADHTMWDYQFAELSKSYQVIRYDTRGWGRSDAATKDFSNSDDLYQLAKYLKIDKFAVIGESGGESTIISFIIAHPAMISCLILNSNELSGLSDNSTPGQKQEHAIRNKRISDIESRSADYKEAIEYLINEDTFCRVEDSGAKTILREMYEKCASRAEDKKYSNTPYLWQIGPAKARPLLAKFEPPTLMIIGERDHQIQSEQEAKRIIDNCRLLIIKDAGYFVMLNKPREFNEAVLRFFAENAK